MSGDDPNYAPKIAHRKWKNKDKVKHEERSYKCLTNTDRSSTRSYEDDDPDEITDNEDENAENEYDQDENRYQQCLLVPTQTWKFGSNMRRENYRTN